MTASSRKNSCTDLEIIDETGGNIAVEEGDLLINETNIDRQTHSSQKYLGCLWLQVTSPASAGIFTCSDACWITCE